MKLNIVYSLVFIFFNFYLGQEVNKKAIKIHSVIDSVKCNIEKYYFEFSDDNLWFLENYRIFGRLRKIDKSNGFHKQSINKILK